MSSMNSSLATADRATHVRIVVMAFIGAITVMLVGFGARAPDMGSAMNGTVQKAGVMTGYSNNDVTVIR